MKQKIHKNSKGGFTIVAIIFVAAIIAAMVLVGYPAITKTFEISRETKDLSSIKNAYSMVLSAYALDSGTDPVAYRLSGPYDADNNEKYLGTNEVIRKLCWEDKSYDYSMYVWITQKEANWQGNSHAISGIEIPSPGENDKMYKVSMNSVTGEITITTTDFAGNRQCMN